MSVTRDECDICGPGNPSDGLKLCADCEAIEDLVDGDIAIVAMFRGD